MLNLEAFTLPILEAKSRPYQPELTRNTLIPAARVCLEEINAVKKSENQRA